MGDAASQVQPSDSGRCPTDNALAALLQSRVTGEKTESVLAHLDDCAACRAAVAAGCRQGERSPGVASGTGLARDEAGGAPVELGSVVGRYVVTGGLGEGGMGVVYAAYDPELDRKVALKVVRPGVRARAAIAAREARALARVSHPNVVTVFDVGYWRDQVYIVMEFVSGLTLRHALMSPDLSSKEVLTTLVSAGAGLAAAHRAGLVHRDVKPENIMVDSHSGGRVTDFGLARALEEVDPHANSLAGTVAYMSPEQLRGEPLDSRSDQFSFAVVAVEALCGRLPFDASPRTDSARVTTPDRWNWTLRGPVPREARNAIARALDPESGRRFATMEEFLTALAPRRRMAWAVGPPVLVATLVAGAVAFALARRDAAENGVCRGAEKSIAVAWGPERADAAERAFAALSVPYARDTFATVRRSLDAYASVWTRAYTGSCEATRLRKEQPEPVMVQHLSCLEERKRDVASLVAELVRPTAKTVEQAVHAVGMLATVESCSDPRTSRTHRHFVDAALSARADALAEAMAGVKAQLSVGGERTAKGAIDGLLSEAQSLGDKRFEAEALWARGDVQRFEQALDAAQASFIESAWAAQADGDDDLVARARLEALEVSADELSSGKASEPLAREAAAAVDRLGAPPRLRAELIMGEANAARSANRWDRALALAEEALRLDPLELEPLVVSDLQSLLGVTLLALSRNDEALTNLRKVVATRESILGPLHPKVARALSNLGYVERQMGDERQARADWERALDILHENELEHRSDGLMLMAELADTDCDARDWSAGISRASRCVALATTRSVRASDKVSCYHAVASCYSGARRFAEARAAYDDALALVPLGGVSADARLGLLAGEAVVDLETGGAARAVPRFEEVLRGCPGCPELTAKSLADVKFNLARALRASHRDRERARELAMEARVAFTSAATPAPERITAVDTFLAVPSLASR